MASLEITGLSVALGDPPREVLSGIDLVADAGSLTLILGANGSGKSVLLRTLIGLHSPKTGRILVDGQEAGRRGQRAFHRRCGVTFQNTDVQIFGDTVEQDLRIGKGANYPLDAPFLHAFGLAELRTAIPHELSGGQRRRLALAGAFLGSPDFLFLDEPFLELDYPHILHVLDRIEAVRAAGSVIVVASHETRDIWEIADTVVLLDGGRVVKSGPPADVIPWIGPAVGLRPRPEASR
jgi:energy-coupling factor transporter ATP-binding protein EcfA2